MNLTLVKYKSQMVVQGKRKYEPPPPSDDLTNADLIRIMPFGLFDLSARKNTFANKNSAYNDRHPETLSRKQIYFLTNLFEIVDKFLDKIPLKDSSKHRITKAIRNDVANLQKNCEGFNKELSQVFLPEFLKVECKEFIDFILEFVNAFHFHDELIQKIPNRPADIKIRILVDQVIKDFQIERNTKEFPNHSYVLRKLNSERGIDKNGNPLPRIKLSRRQYNNFRSWRVRGTYWWFIQPK